jgi:general secretion pathway protein G
MLSSRSGRRTGGFSLLELVIVVVVIGIIAAIAIPRMSRGSAGASDSALSGNLAVLRNGIDLFAAEHNGKFPALADVAAMLTQYSDGNATTTVATKDTDHPYGPYVRAVPALPVGANKGSNTFTGTLGTEGFGWFYNASTGEIKANCAATEKDGAGKTYDSY